MLTPNLLGLFDRTNRYAALSQNCDPLGQLAQMIPWEEFCPSLEAVLRRS